MITSLFTIKKLVSLVNCEIVIEFVNNLTTNLEINYFNNIDSDII